MKTKLLLVITTDNVETIMKFPLLYGGVSLPRGYWQKVHVMFWGASIKEARDNLEIRQKVQEMQKEGVTFSACIVCAEEYGAISALEAVGIVCDHTGTLMTEALKDERWSVLTI